VLVYCEGEELSQGASLYWLLLLITQEPPQWRNTVGVSLPWDLNMMAPLLPSGVSTVVTYSRSEGLTWGFIMLASFLDARSPHSCDILQGYLSPWQESPQW
jgi:hypothetical protein